VSSYPLSYPILMQLEFYRQFFQKYSRTSFHDNSSSGNLVVPCVQMDGRTNMTKLTVAFRNFAKASKMRSIGMGNDLFYKVPGSDVCRENITFLHPSTSVRTLSERSEYTRVCIAIYLRQSHMSHHAASSDGYACCLSLLFTRLRNTVECFSIASPGPACCDPSNLP